MKVWASIFVIAVLSIIAPVAAAADAPPLSAFAPCAYGSADCNACVADAVGAINRLRSHGDAMGFHMNGTPDVTFGKHWQGVQRLMGGSGRYLAISRSLESESTDVSFVIVEMATRNGDAVRFRSNRLNPNHSIFNTAPPAGDRVIWSQPHEAGFDHAGGIQALGNILAVPFEGGSPGSKVVFYDVANPLQPVRLNNIVPHVVFGGVVSSEAGTATLGKLADGRFVLVIGRSNANTLDFYVSTGTDPRTTSYVWFDTWEEDELTGDDSEFGNYQNLNFVAQCDGALFMVGTHRNSGGGFGDDFIDLFRVTNGSGDDVAIAKVAKKQLTCSGNCDFDAAGGVYVDRGGQLYVYGTTHDNDGAPFHAFAPCAGPGCSTEFAEFRPVPHDTCEEIEHAWAELYVDHGFGGRSLMVDFVDRDLENYSNFDSAESFEDATSAVRWCLPNRATLRLWQDKNACGGNHFDLTGNDTFRNISDLSAFGFGDATSCAEWKGGPFARAGADRVVECTGSTTAVQLDGQASILLESGPLTFSWQAAGVTFDDATSATPIGSFPFAQTNVTLTVSDGTASDSDVAAVKIVDTIKPSISCPTNVVVDATMPAGAIVNYPGPIAADSCSVPSVVCELPSGSTFGVGTSTVQCTATDGASQTAACSFTVKVKSPAEQAGELIDEINGLPGVKDSTKHSFVAKLEAAIAALAAGSTSACGNLQALINAVQAQAGKELTDAQASDLLADITRIRGAIGCL